MTRPCLLPFIAAALLAGCAGLRPTPAMNTAHPELVRRLYEDLINHRRFESFGDVLADDFETSDGAKGPAAFADAVKGLAAAFPDITFTIEDLFTGGENKVVARWKWTGTHRGAFAGVAPTQRAVQMLGIVIYEERDGKLSRSWLQNDRLGLLRQLGALPNPSGPGPATTPRP